MLGAGNSPRCIRHFAFDGADDESVRRPRLDHFLARCDLGITRSQIKRLIEDGDVQVGDAVTTKPGHKLHPGDDVAVTLRPPADAVAKAQDIPLDVLHEDRDLIVLVKPAGLVVHPAPGHPDGTLVNALLHHCDDLAGIGGELRPGIVHRLDKDTSGVMVAAKNDASHNALIEMFKAHALERSYLALVAPTPGRLSGTFSTLHGRHPSQRKKFSSRVQRGKTAVTHYRVLESLAHRAALIRCRLETGRTHQIRVHFADHGSPVIGDPLYGRRHRGTPLSELSAGFGRQALHAAVLAFDHPITGQGLRFETEPPDDMRQLLATLRSEG